MELLIAIAVVIVFVYGLRLLGRIAGFGKSAEQDRIDAALTALQAKTERLHQEQLKFAERLRRLEAAPSVAPIKSAASAAIPKAPAPLAPPASPEAGTPPKAEPAAKRPIPRARPTRQPAPTKPNPFVQWLLGGNTVVRAGVVILFFGIAFALKYTYERIEVPPELRLVGIAAMGIALLAIGWRLRMSRRGYALALQGGGVGVLYLTIFAALRLYDLLPASAAFVMLAGVAVFSALLAVRQDALSLAALGTAGGFLTPLLASTGAGSHVQLFSYYALLNAGIVAIAWHKAWRLLNLLGFAFTFVIGLLWGARFYRPELFATTEPFLLLFFLMYVAIPILFATRQSPELRGYVDGTLVFGTPLVTFGLQLGLVSDYEYGAAYSALALGAFYLALASILISRPGMRLLAEAFLALGVAFGTLAIPLAFEGRWTAAAWALEGGALLWIGVRQDRMLARVFAIALQFAAGFAFLIDQTMVSSQVPVLNSLTLGKMLIALAALFSAWYSEQRASALKPFERAAGHALFVWGALWWFAAGYGEIERHISPPYRINAMLLYLAGSIATLSSLGMRRQWSDARLSAMAWFPLLVLGAALTAFRETHPAAHFGFAAWPVGFALHFVLLRRHETEFPEIASWWHAAGLWLAAALASWELAWWIGRLVEVRSVWPLIAWALVPGILVWMLVARGEQLAWPVARHLRVYLESGCGPLAMFLIVWGLYANFFATGDPSPLPYLPLLNPLDLALVGSLLVVSQCLLDLERRGWQGSMHEQRGLVRAGLGLAAFLTLNGMLLRALHHLAGVPFALDAMLRSMLVQAAFSILWTSAALALMVIATRRALRPLWLAGAGLMGVVVLKLFVVDLSNVGGIERIASFISVGVLMLVIGYFSPVPPKVVNR